jgi:hypothetical protein
LAVAAARNFDLTGGISSFATRYSSNPNSDKLATVRGVIETGRETVLHRFSNISFDGSHHGLDTGDFLHKALVRR